MADDPPPYEAYPETTTSTAASTSGYGAIVEQPQPPYPPQPYPHQSCPVEGYPTQAYPPQAYPGHTNYPGEVKEKTPLIADTVYPVPAGATIIVPTPYIVWGKYPVQTTCLNCQQVVLTDVEFVTGSFTWLIAGVILLIGGWILCCLIPFFAESCKDARHTCPNCHAHIHTWQRL